MRDFLNVKTKFSMCVSVEKSQSNKTILTLRCECGNTFQATPKQIYPSSNISCGCRNRRGNKLPILGDRFGKLTFISPTDKIGVRGNPAYLFRCDCGNYEYLELNTVLTGVTSSCGCIRRENGIENINKKYKNKKYNMLTFIKHTEKWAGPSPGKNPIVLWRCDCGREKEIRLGDVREGKTTCCGCRTGRDGGFSQVGDKWNKLTLIRILGKKHAQNYGLFRCDCGVEVKSKLTNVKGGYKKSCGCDLSEILRGKRGFLLDETVFEEINDNSAYWLGFLMADGNISKNTICINLKASDVEHLEKFRNFVGGNQKISVAKDPRIVRYAFGSIKITKDLQKLGVEKAKSYSAKPHPHLTNNPSYWRGVIDGDGSIVNKHTAVSLCGTKAMCEGFLEFAKHYCTTKATVRQVKENLWSIRIGVGRKYNIKLLKVLYENGVYYLDRKYKDAMLIIKHVEKKHA